MKPNLNDNVLIYNNGKLVGCSTIIKVTQNFATTEVGVKIKRSTGNTFQPSTSNYHNRNTTFRIFEGAFKDLTHLLKNRKSNLKDSIIRKINKIHDLELLHQISELIPKDK